MNPAALLLACLSLHALAQEEAPEEVLSADPPVEAQPGSDGLDPTDAVPAPETFTPELLGDTPPDLSPSEAGEPPAPPPDLVQVSPEELHLLEARAMARMALELTVDGRWEEARALFTRLEAGYGDTPEGLRAAAHVRSLNLITAGGPVPYVAVSTGDGGFEIRDPRSGRRVELDARPRAEPLNGGRRELMVSQAVIGAGLLGVAVPVAIDQEVLGAAVLGLGVGASGGALTAALLTRHHPVTRGQAASIATGELLGGWNGAVLGVAFGGEEPWQVALPIVGGTILGGLAGTEAAIQGKPGAGQVAMVAQGGLWGLGLGGLSFLVVPSDTTKATVIRLGVASDLGAVAGAGLATRFHPSRRRVNLIGLSGCVGLATGAGAQALLREAVVDSEEVTAASLAVGALGGLGLGTYLTRSVDGSDEEGAASLGRPAPWVGQTQDGAPVVGVTLAGGRF